MTDSLEPTYLDAEPDPIRVTRTRRARTRPPLRDGNSIDPGMALFPLRLFLGGTFVYAGIQKLSDPGFLHRGAPTYIGTQLQGFANHTPGGFVLRTFAIPHAELAGVGVAIVEIALGLLVLLGLFTRLAALGGLDLNLLLFLTASWHTTPYFLGPDIVFTFAWLPFVLAGARGQPALDNVLQSQSPAMAGRSGSAGALQPAGAGGSAMSRRTLLAEVGAAALTLAGISALLKGSYTGTSLASNAKIGGHARRAGSSAHGGSSAPSGSANSSASSGGGASSQASLPANAVKLGPSNRLAAGQAAEYSDPTDGSPDILIRSTDGSLKSFSAVCTHAGCTVGYSSGEIVCPCHGGVYSASTGAVVGGPPPAGLAPKKVVEQAGQIYAVPS